MNSIVAIDDKELAQLQASDGDQNHLVICAEFTVYWRGSCFDRSRGLVRFYRKVVEDLGPHFKYYETGTMSGAKALRTDSLELLPFWLEKSRPRKDIYQLYLESGAHRNEPSDCSVYFVADEEEEEPVGALKINMPADWLARDPGGFLNKVLHYVDDLDFESGHAGYGVNWNPRGDGAIEAQAAMSQIAARYRGIDLFDLDVTLVSMLKTKPAGIKCVNWLTLIGDELVSLLGGAEQLGALVREPCRIYPLRHGVLLQAGQQPSLGKRNRQDDMQSYHAIGRLLSRFRFKDHRPIFGSPNDPERDETGRWLARFDD